MRGSGRRGSAFVTVIAVLMLISILMELALSLLVSHISESRRRGDSAYATQLALSGLDWARAQIASGSAPSGRLEVQGGTIEVAFKLDGEMLLITARGTVTRGRSSRQATMRIRPPEPAAAPAPSPRDAPPPVIDPEAAEPGGEAAPTPAPAPSFERPRAPDPTTELRAVRP